MSVELLYRWSDMRMVEMRDIKGKYIIAYQRRGRVAIAARWRTIDWLYTHRYPGLLQYFYYFTGEYRQLQADTNARPTIYRNLKSQAWGNPTIYRQPPPTALHSPNT